MFAINKLYKGSQVFRLIRGCSAKQTEDTCKASGNQFFKYKDCVESCNNSDGPCNNNNTIYEKISDDVVTKCHQCYYEEKDNGYVQGNMKCNSTETLTDFSQEWGNRSHFFRSKDFKDVTVGLVPTSSRMPKWFTLDVTEMKLEAK